MFNDKVPKELENLSLPPGSKIINTKRSYDKTIMLAIFLMASSTAVAINEALGNWTVPVIILLTGIYLFSLTTFNRKRQKSQFLKKNSETSEALFIKGVDFADAGRHEDAITSFEEALELEPNLQEAWYNKACCLSLLKRKSESLSALAEAIKLNPEYKKDSYREKEFAWIRDDIDFLSLVK